MPRERATIVVTIDVSQSMEAVPPDSRAKPVGSGQDGGRQFVTSLPPKYNVALVTICRHGDHHRAADLDRGAVTAAIAALQPQPSTAIGEGIYTSLAALAQVPPDPNHPDEVVPARIVLLSDGKTQVGRSSTRAAAPHGASEYRSTPSPTAPRTAISRSTAAGSLSRSTEPRWNG